MVEEILGWLCNEADSQPCAILLLDSTHYPLDLFWYRPSLPGQAPVAGDGFFYVHSGPLGERWGLRVASIISDSRSNIGIESYSSGQPCLFLLSLDILFVDCVNDDKPTSKICT